MSTPPANGSPGAFGHLARLLVAVALLAFPPRFRRRVGPDMRATFDDRLSAAAARGGGAAVRTLLRTLGDLLASAAREWTRPAGRRGRLYDHTTTGGGGMARTRGGRGPRGGWRVAGTRGGGWMADALRQDLRFAGRSLLRRPGFTLVAVATLAIGIGANTSIFSVVDTVLLTPLPYPEPDRIVTIWVARGAWTHGSMSAVDLFDVEATDAFDVVVGHSSDESAWTGDGEARLVRSAEVTGELFRTFGLAPSLGREIRREDAVQGGPMVVMVSHRFWQDQLGGDPDVLGRTLELDGRSWEVVGVGPEAFDFPSRTDVWFPYRVREGCGRGCHQLEAAGRLAAGTGVGSARQKADALAQHLQDEFPDTNFGKGFNLVPLAEEAVADVRAGLWILLGAVGLVLLIVCANVANLLLVRAQTRTGEVAVRAALGASRGRLALQVLVESLVLATVGGVVGVGLSVFGVDLIRALAPADVPRLDQVAVDGTTLLFATGLVVLVALLFGAFPAVRLARTSPARDLAAGGRGAAAGPGARSRNLLLVAEVALSMVLLTGAGLFLKSFARLVEVDPGYETREVIRFSLWLPQTRYEDLESLEGFFGTLEERVAALPSVASVGSVLGAPLDDTNIIPEVIVEGRPEPGPGEGSVAALRPATPGYFETLGIPLLRGRGLRASDGPDAMPVAVVTQRFADEVFPGEDPLGRRVTMTADFGYGKPTFEIVGVVADVMSESLTLDKWSGIYVPLAQMGPGYATVHVRAEPGSPSAVPALRAIVAELDSDLPLRGLETMDEVVSGELAPGRFYLLLLGFFALVAVGLAAMGLYGVVAYLVTVRTRELGVRVALGADRTEVVGLLIRQGMRPAVLGVLLGLGAALAGGSVLEGLLFQVAPRDPVVFGGVMVLLLGVVLAATALPAWRATRIPVSEALRGE